MIDVIVKKEKKKEKKKAKLILACMSSSIGSRTKKVIEPLLCSDRSSQQVLATAASTVYQGLSVHCPSGSWQQCIWEPPLEAFTIPVVQKRKMKLRDGAWGRGTRSWYWIQCCFSGPTHAKGARVGAAVLAGPGARSLCRVTGLLLYTPYASWTILFIINPLGYIWVWPL